MPRLGQPNSTHRRARQQRPAPADPTPSVPEGPRQRTRSAARSLSSCKTPLSTLPDLRPGVVQKLPQSSGRSGRVRGHVPDHTLVGVRRKAAQKFRVSVRSHGYPGTRALVGRDSNYGQDRQRCFSPVSHGEACLRKVPQAREPDSQGRRKLLRLAFMVEKCCSQFGGRRDRDHRPNSLQGMNDPTSLLCFPTMMSPYSSRSATHRKPVLVSSYILKKEPPC